MSIDRDTLAEKTAAVDRHLGRVAEKLPPDVMQLRPMSDESDAVMLHLWQAIQIVIDLAVSACVKLGLGAPPSYADAFRRLAEQGFIDTELCTRLARAAGFRNILAHAYESIDLAVVHRAATEGPADLRKFLSLLAKLP